MTNVERMSELQTELERKSRISGYALIGVLFLCFIGYMLYRRYTSHQLVMAHRQLKEAYEELESHTAAKERAALEQEIAGHIQEALTPAALPKHKNVQMFATIKPGKMQGGGLCDCLLRDGKLFFCVGDAAGKGAKASALTAITKTQFRLAAAYEEEPERIVAIMKAALDKGMHYFVGVLDLASGSLKTVNEDYHLPLLMINEEVNRLTDEEQLQPGSLLFFYTDGLVYAMNGDGKKYGEKKILGAALQAMKLDPTPQPFVESMMEAVNRFTGDTEQESDINMFAIRYTKG